MARNAQRVETACRATLYACSKSDCVQQRLAEKVLQLMPHLSEKQFTKYCRQIQRSDPVRGPFAVAWLLGACFRHKEPPAIRMAIEALLQDGRVMRKIRKANEAWGMEPIDVVHYRAPKQLPRYSSEPLLGDTLPP